MIKSIRYAFTIVLVVFAIGACNAAPAKLEGAFGIKFGADIEDVRRELTKLGEIDDNGSVIETKNVIDQNPLFDHYSIYYVDNTIYWILAGTKKELKEDHSKKIFAKLEAVLESKYGEGLDLAEGHNPSKQDESIIKEVIKKSWLVGSDSLDLSLEYFSDTTDGYFVNVSYYSVETMQKLAEIHLSKQSQEHQEKIISKGL